MSEETKGITKDDFMKNVIYLGIQGKENVETALKALAEKFPDKHIYIMDKQMFNRTGHAFVEQHLKWKEQQKLQEYVSDPQKMQDAMIVMMKIIERLGENKWFHLKDIVDSTTMTYPQAQSTLNLLFAFGMAASRPDPEVSTRMQWRIIKDEQAKLNYVEELASSLEEESKQLRAAAEDIKKQMLPNLEKQTREVKKQPSKKKDTAKK